MKRLAFLTLLMVIFVPWLVMAQTTPCQASGTAGVLNPTAVYITSSDLGTTEVDGSYRVASVAVNFYAQGATSPMQTSTVARASWTLYTGSTDCWGASLPSAPLVAGTSYYATAVEKGANGVDSAASPNSNPFGKSGNTTAATVVRVR